MNNQHAASAVAAAQWVCLMCDNVRCGSTRNAAALSKKDFSGPSGISGFSSGFSSSSRKALLASSISSSNTLIASSEPEMGSSFEPA